MKKVFTYQDSEAGMQHEKFNSLEELIDHIKSFGYIEESDGKVYKDNEPILEYVSREKGLSWSKYED